MRGNVIFETVIGLEVHVQLKTKSKLFSGASTEFGGNPNSQVSFIDAGFPGVLPVLNIEAVRMAIQFGLAIKGTIHNGTYFERKNYFYPDLPKGYQISQLQKPIVTSGYLDIELPNNIEKKIEIVRAHLEEDAGKSLHHLFPQYSGIDLNRAGNPLLEIVTAPCFSSAEEAVEYLKTLHQLVRFLGICDGNMQEGSFRCDVNLSLRPQGSSNLGIRTEIKNLNSFRFIEQAIHYEENRHRTLLERGDTIYQETRLYSPENKKTEVLRRKENENDYRYFSEPDLLPIVIDNKDVELIRQSLPTLPQAIKQSLQNIPDLDPEDCSFILSDPAIYYYFTLIKQNSVAASEKIIINWLKGPYVRLLKEKNLKLENSPLPAKYLSVLLDHMVQEDISYQSAKKIFEEIWGQVLDRRKENETIDIIKMIKAEKNKTIKNNNLLDEAIDLMIQKYPEQVSEYKNGKKKLLSFFVGQVMKEIKGQADPQILNRLLIKKLNMR